MGANGGTTIECGRVAFRAESNKAASWRAGNNGGTCLERCQAEPVRDVPRGNGEVSMRRRAQGFGFAVLSLAIGALALSRTGLAAAPTVNVPAKVSSMADAVRVGQDLYTHETFGGVRTCDACHTNGGRGPGKLPNGAAIPGLEGAAAVFPRFVPAAGRVITLEQQIQKCIEGAEKGKPPALGSVALGDLAAYVTSLSKGKAMGGQFAGN